MHEHVRAIPSTQHMCHGIACIESASSARGTCDTKSARTVCQATVTAKLLYAAHKMNSRCLYHD